MKFLKSIIVEMKKVSWPTKKQLRKDTIIVFEMSIIFAILFFIFDTIIKNGLNAILNLR
ncbi:MAG: preprotein translocase subunit SecE [Streptococcaceae bacterium]|jgi:preprotein translocase subunit SecE|nr:preprotein translocase subunit SecE [Streptococcaceae bacterium]